MTTAENESTIKATQKTGDSKPDTNAPHKSKSIQQTTTVIQESHVGPIPSAIEMGRYEQIMPGAMDRITALNLNAPKLNWQTGRWI